MRCEFCNGRGHARPQCPVEVVWLKNIERLRRT